MKPALIVIFALIILKFYSFSLLCEKKLENNVASDFLYFDSTKIESVIQNQEADILNFSKAREDWYQSFKKLSNQIKQPCSLEELSEEFNSSEFRNYVENVGLTKEHNRLLIINEAYNKILEKLSSSSITQVKERPYILSLKRNLDSMNLILGYAMYGEIRAQVIHNRDTINTNILPVNIGPVKGEVTFLVTSSKSKEMRCYKKRY